MDGTPLIIRIPGCTNLFKMNDLINKQTGKLWTDGRDERSMDWWESPRLCKSPSEGVLFWSNECETINMPFPDFASKWPDLEYAKEPTETDYFAALESGIATTKKKAKFIRRHLWWLANNPIRLGTATELSPQHRANLIELIKLLDESPQERLLKADAFRQLGRFEEALTVLERGYPLLFARTVALIKSLCAKKDCRVAEIIEPPRQIPIRSRNPIVRALEWLKEEVAFALAGASLARLMAEDHDSEQEKP